MKSPDVKGRLEGEKSRAALKEGPAFSGIFGDFEELSPKAGAAKPQAWQALPLLCGVAAELFYKHLLTQNISSVIIVGFAIKKRRLLPSGSIASGLWCGRRDQD
jgi:hypothetical protein